MIKVAVFFFTSVVFLSVLCQAMGSNTYMEQKEYNESFETGRKKELTVVFKRLKATPTMTPTITPTAGGAIRTPTVTQTP